MSTSIRLWVGAAFIIGSAPLQAQSDSTASRWLVLQQDSGARLSLDTAKVQRTGSTVSYWLEERLRHPRPNKSVGRPFTRSLMQFEMDCVARTIRPLFVAYYSSDDRLLGSFDTQSFPRSGVSPIVPGTQGEYVERYVCHQ